MPHPDTTSYSLTGVQYGADVRVEWVASGARGDLGVWEALRGDMVVGRVVVRRV